MTTKTTSDSLNEQNKQKLYEELLELKLKTKITLNDKYRIQKLQQILDTLPK